MHDGDEAERKRAEALEASTYLPPRPAPAVEAAVDPLPDPAAPTPDERGRGPEPGVPPFPVPNWDRYRPIRFLGQGGMGRVFLAFDLRLQREVALKFVRGDDPDLTRRILMEARAQARVNHERVCKVFEVGEVSGLTFIAMQFVDGVPLNEVGPTLTTEQRAIVMRDVALGVHEAHRVGLIHRDLKPANVMVEQAEGPLRPYVVDFGLARPWNQSDTATGSVLGTPHYMSPEQARGEVNRLDRRADVYSLGATLYQLLTGRTPISGENALEVLARIQVEEPRPPRALDPDVPEDLGAIALRCLEKDRSARYDSARALAEDLDRFLAGEPIQARAGLWYRLRRRARKYRAVLAAGAAALLVVSVAAGWVAVTRRDAALREQLARRFTERVESIEARARYAALAPLHDIRKDRAALRASMAELEEEIRKGGARAVGPGQYALGRGYLALDEHGKALQALRAAWDAGFREPRVAYALALALGHEYQEKLGEAQRIQDQDRRKARWAEVQRLYQAPVLEYLRQSAGADVPSAEYVQALLAFYEQRYDDALARLDAIGEALPWFYEAAQLRGDIFWARSFARWERGDQQGQRSDFAAGRRAYESAAGAARSLPSLDRALARLELFALMSELYGGGDVQPHYDRGVQALESAQAADPDDAEGWLLRSQLHRRLAEFRLTHGGEVEEPLARAQEAATKAVDAGPALFRARMELSQVHRLRGRVLEERKKDPRPDLRRATELLEGGNPADQDAEYFLLRGLAFNSLAEAEDARQEDGATHREQVIDAYLTVTRLDDHWPVGWLNLGRAYFARAQSPRAKEPEADLNRAREAVEKARRLNPQFVVAYNYLGRISQSLALRARARGGDPLPMLNEAIDQYRQGLERNPNLLALRNGLGTVHLDVALAEWDAGRDPFPSLERARGEFERMQAQEPKHPSAALNLAETAVLELRLRVKLGADPTSRAPAALESCRRAAALVPDGSMPLALQALAQLSLARFDLARGRSPDPSLAAARAAAEAARAKGPPDELTWLAVAGAGGMGALRGAPFEAAQAVYEEGMKAQPDVDELRVDDVSFCLAYAERPSADGTRALEQARRLVDGMLVARPGWAEARALRAWVMALEGGRAAAGRRLEILQRAADELTAALSANPNLVPAWSDRREALGRWLAEEPR